MNDELLRALKLCETDVEGALVRFCGDESLYLSCLRSFTTDPTLGQLSRAIETKSWDDAFTAAHALKGLAGNMGFVPLFHATSELVIIIRAGRLNDVSPSCAQVKSCYDHVVFAISKNLPAE